MRFSMLRLQGVLEQPEDHKLRRSHRSDTNLADQPSVQDVILRHCRSIAANEECVSFSGANERPIPPLRKQE